MKIENRENVKGTIRTIVFYKNERYVRLQKSQYNNLDMEPVVQWKKLKTNHLVKADKSKTLEDNFKEVDTITKPISHLVQTLSSASTVLYDFKLSDAPLPPFGKSFEDKRVDKELIENHLKSKL